MSWSTNILPADFASLTPSVRLFQKPFTDSYRRRANLDKLILLNIFQRRLKTHLSDRSYAGSLIFARYPNIGKLLTFYNIDRYVFFLAVLPDHLSFIHLFPCFNKKDSSV